MKSFFSFDFKEFKMNKNKYVPVRLAEDDFQKLTELSNKLKRNKSEIIRLAITSMYDKY